MTERTIVSAAMWNHPGAKSLYRILCENGENKVDLVMGCHEIDGNTLTVNEAPMGSVVFQK